jgi:hypothetical protein
MRDWGDEMMSRSTGGFNKIINLSFNDLILTASNGDFAVLTKDDSKIQYKGNLYYKMALQNSDRVNIMIPSMDAYRAFKAWATGDQQALSDILNNKDQEIKENQHYSNYAQFNQAKQGISQQNNQANQVLSVLEKIKNDAKQKNLSNNAFLTNIDNLLNNLNLIVSRGSIPNFQTDMELKRKFLPLKDLILKNDPSLKSFNPDIIQQLKQLFNVVRI